MLSLVTSTFVHTVYSNISLLSRVYDLFSNRHFCTLGWAYFALFLEFHQKSWVCSSPRYNMVFSILVQKPVSATPLKVHNFKKKSKRQKIKNLKIIFFEKCVLKCLYYTRR